MSFEVSQTFNEYLDQRDWRVKENSNTSFSFGSLCKHVNGKASALFWEELYDEVDPEILQGHRKGDYHIHDLGSYSSYCLGASLKDLLLEGIKGPSNISVSGPAKRFRAACAHIANAIGMLQNEVAGAVAFSSVNVYLAPFIYFDALRRRGIKDLGTKVDLEYNDRDYEDIYQSIESLVYQLNQNLRHGCVDEETELMTPTGFKKFNELSVGDEVYTWKDGNLNINKIEKMNIFDFEGDMHLYRGKDYVQFVTPNHRVLTKVYNGDNYRIIKSEDLFDHKTPPSLPVAALDNDFEEAPFSDELIQLVAFILTEGSVRQNTFRLYKSPNRWGNETFVNLLKKLGLDYTVQPKVTAVSSQNDYGDYEVNYYNVEAPKITEFLRHKKDIPQEFLKLSKRQSRLFLETWYKLDGSFQLGKNGQDVSRRLQCDTQEIADKIQIMAQRACLGSMKKDYDWNGRLKEPTLYVHLYEFTNKAVTSKEKVYYEGKVWCPTTEDGVVIFRKDGRTFVSGNSEPPFSNFTLDFAVPGPLKKFPVIINGENKDQYTYEQFQKEADIFTEVFSEIMIKGDYSGKPFAYPIPTFNVGKSMNWESHPQVWELAAKNGAPYFGNFLQGSLNEDDVYSMCPLTSNTEIIVRSSHGVSLRPIGQVYNYATQREGANYEVWTPNGWRKASVNRMPMTRVFEVKLSNGAMVEMGENHLQPTRDNGTLSGKDLKVDMWLPFNKKPIYGKEGSFDLGYAVGAFVGDGMRNYLDLFAEDEDFHYFRIVEIKEKKVNPNNASLYCMEVEDDSHLFTLANGLITHNCRLRLDKKELQNKTGGLFGAAERTGCHDDQTEVLTDQGWKLFSHLTGEERVLTMDSSRDLEWNQIDQQHEYSYDSDLYYLGGVHLDMALTPNHRMCISKKSNQFKFLELEEALNTYTRSFDIPHNNKLDFEPETTVIVKKVLTESGKNPFNDVQVELEDWVSFLGIWLSEGSISRNVLIDGSGRRDYRVTVSQTKPDNTEKIRELFERLPWSFSYDKGNFNIYNKPLWTYLKQFGYQEQRFIPDDIKKQPARVLEVFWDWLMLGDGCIHKHTGEQTYYTTSKLLANDIQEMLIYMGDNSVSRVRPPRDVEIKGRKISAESCKPCFEITRMSKRNYSVMLGNVEKKHYKGKVYCLSVKNGTLLTRRNGRINWSGNSIGVFTINFPAIAFRAGGSKKEFFKDLDKQMELGYKQLERKRDVIQKEFDRGLFPALKQYLKRLNTLFSTIGFVGGHEMCLNFLGKGIETKEGRDFTIEVMHFMREKLAEFQVRSEETRGTNKGTLFNLEYTPAESTCYRLAMRDKKRYLEVQTAGTEERPYYTNSTHLPVGIEWGHKEVFEHQDSLLSLATGGSVYHTYIAEPTTADLAKKFVKTVFENYDIPYLSISPVYTVCDECGFIPGKKELCPKCGKETRIFQRVTGYCRSVAAYNDGKAQEFGERTQRNLESL